MFVEHTKPLEQEIERLQKEVDFWKKAAESCPPLPNEKLVPYHSTEWSDLISQGWTTWFVRDDGIAQMIPPSVP